jgi:hypothetical protein
LVTSSDILIIPELLDVSWRIAEYNALIEDQRRRIEELGYEGHDITPAQIVLDSLCERLDVLVQTEHRLRAMLKVKVA